MHSKPAFAAAGRPDPEAVRVRADGPFCACHNSDFGLQDSTRKPAFDRIDRMRGACAFADAISITDGRVRELPVLDPTSSFPSAKNLFPNGYYQNPP